MLKTMIRAHLRVRQQVIDDAFSVAFIQETKQHGMLALVLRYGMKHPLQLPGSRFSRSADADGDDVPAIKLQLRSRLSVRMYDSDPVGEKHFELMNQLIAYMIGLVAMFASSENTNPGPVTENPVDLPETTEVMIDRCQGGHSDGLPHKLFREVSLLCQQPFQLA
ncbi:MAG TPA: hypothetical protein VEF05_09045 [Terriglobales bacterium]|nr:hypothetical protein [Terriglobales bacterium]